MYTSFSHNAFSYFHRAQLSDSFMENVVFQGEVVNLPCDPQPGKSGATFILAPIFQSMSHGWPYQELTLLPK